jgi:hypothetical protein
MKAEKMKYDSRKAARHLQLEVEKHRRTLRKLIKDAVLHLRIERDIMKRIKAEAEAREMSISDLVRTYLVERFSENRAEEGSPKFLLATSAFSDVEVIQDTHCAICDELITRGTHARLAHGPSPPERMVCPNCYDNLQSQFLDQAAPAPGDE